MSETFAKEHWINESAGVLRSRACRHLDSFPGIRSLQPTDVVNEAILRIEQSGWFAPGVKRIDVMRAISREMRDCLIEHLRRRAAKKRGEGRRPAQLTVEPCGEEKDIEMQLDLKHAIEGLREQHSRQADVVEMKFFGRFSTKEIAEELRVSVSTVEKDWRQARGRLFAMLRPGWT